MNKYNIGPGDRLFACMTEPENPDVEVLEGLVIAAALQDEDERNDDALKGVLNAYTALLELDDEGEDVEVETVHDDDDCAAERLYLKYAYAGYRQVLPDFKKVTDNDLSEYVTWYTFEKLRWPAALMARIGYMQGVRDAQQSKAMSAYFAEQRAS